MPPASDLSPSSPRRSRWQVWVALALVVVLGGHGLTKWYLSRRASATPVIARNNLLFQSGRWFQLPATNAFTGWMVEYNPDGLLLSRAAVFNGLLNGVSEGYYTNGQIQIREYYKDSVADGLRQKWYENGQMKSEARIVAGKLEGTFRSWHENGQLAEQIEMSQGNPDGEARAFYPSGFVKAETRVRAGKVLDQKSWEDGEHRQASASANDPLRSKVN